MQKVEKAYMKAKNQGGMGDSLLGDQDMNTQMGNFNAPSADDYGGRPTDLVPGGPSMIVQQSINFDTMAEHEAHDQLKQNVLGAEEQTWMMQSQAARENMKQLEAKGGKSFYIKRNDVIEEERHAPRCCERFYRAIARYYEYYIMLTFIHLIVMFFVFNPFNCVNPHACLKSLQNHPPRQNETQLDALQWILLWIAKWCASALYVRIFMLILVYSRAFMGHLQFTLPGNIYFPFMGKHHPAHEEWGWMFLALQFTHSLAHWLRIATQVDSDTPVFGEQGVAVIPTQVWISGWCLFAACMIGIGLLAYRNCGFGRCMLRQKISWEFMATLHIGSVWAMILMAYFHRNPDLSCTEVATITPIEAAEKQALTADAFYNVQRQFPGSFEVGGRRLQTGNGSGTSTPAPVASTPAPVASTPAPVASTPAPVVPVVEAFEECIARAGSNYRFFKCFLTCFGLWLLLKMIENSEARQVNCVTHTIHGSCSLVVVRNFPFWDRANSQGRAWFSADVKVMYPDVNNREWHPFTCIVSAATGNGFVLIKNYGDWSARFTMLPAPYIYMAVPPIVVTRTVPPEYKNVIVASSGTFITTVAGMVSRSKEMGGKGTKITIVWSDREPIMIALVVMRILKYVKQTDFLIYCTAKKKEISYHIGEAQILSAEAAVLGESGVDTREEKALFAGLRNNLTDAKPTQSTLMQDMLGMEAPKTASAPQQRKQPKDVIELLENLFSGPEYAHIQIRAGRPKFASLFNELRPDYAYSGAAPPVAASLEKEAKNWKIPFKGYKYL